MGAKTLFSHTGRIAWKDLTELFRNRFGLVLLIVMPLFMMVMVGFIYQTSGAKNLPVAIVNDDSGFGNSTFPSQVFIAGLEQINNQTHFLQFSNATSVSDLKDLIQKGRLLQDIKEAAPAGHNILDLWKTCRKLLNDISPGDSVEEIEQINRLIAEFCRVDPKSTAFRYPEDREGKPSLPGIKHVNIRNVADVIEKISAILESANAVIGEYLLIKDEVEREYYSDL